jgi:hypothetical protein
MKIVVEFIPHQKQRYHTPGDYWIDKGGDLQIRISEMFPKWFSWLVLLHEMVEICLCMFSRVDFKKIDAFDMKFEKDRLAGKHAKEEEPGDDPDAPYHIQHCFATAVERMACAAMFLSWKKYDEACLALEWKLPKEHLYAVD